MNGHLVWLKKKTYFIKRHKINGVCSSKNTNISNEEKFSKI